jgi:hypothetical protein
VAVSDKLTKVSMRRLSGHAEDPSDLTGLERFVALEEIDNLTFPACHVIIVTQSQNNRKRRRQNRKWAFGARSADHRIKSPSVGLSATTTAKQAQRNPTGSPVSFNTLTDDHLAEEY